ncbi:MAG: mandelate racemase/muconate lactonizing enzyme family protein [Myxococcota bacterium]
MKIVDFLCRPFQKPFRRPVRIGRAACERREGVVVTLVSEEGRRGQGEASPLVELGTESLRATTEVLSKVATLLAGVAVPCSLEEIDALMSAEVFEGAPAARHGVELALLDLLAQSRGEPIARVLANGTARSSVWVNMLLDAHEPTALAEQGAQALLRGFDVLKVKVGSDLCEDAARLRALRARVGPKVRIRIDANGAWSEGQARTALRGLSPLALELCEQPVAAHDPAALRRVRQLVDCPIAADEALAQEESRTDVLDPDRGPAADVLVLKPMVLGGLLPALKLARKGKEHGVGAYVTTTMDGWVARKGAAHLAAAIPQSEWASGLATGALFAEGADESPAVVAAHASLSLWERVGVRGERSAN